jgi:hypothetical protein
VKHFSEELWSDFARNAVSENARMQMQHHLDGGCKACAATLTLWRNVLVIAEKEQEFRPPNETLRIVKSQFAPPQIKTTAGVRLLFDSRLQPVTAGIRGSISATQFLFETDEFFIDLRLEPRREADRACLVGQVLKRTGQDQVVQGVTVRLQEGNRSIAQTSTNSLGEFQLEFTATNQLFIAISRDTEGPVILPLYGFGGNTRR